MFPVEEAPGAPELDGAALTVSVASVAVALGSSVNPPVDALDDFAASVCEFDVVTVVAAACVVLVWLVAFVVDVLELRVVTVTPGHKAWIPIPFWKTPIMDVSPTSMSAQFFLTASSILTRPCTQAALQVAAGLKSSATQPPIWAL